MLEPVGAAPGGLEGQQRVKEVGYAEGIVGPLAQVGDERAVVLGVVRQERGELADRVDDAVQYCFGVDTRGGALGVEVDGAVLGLPGTDLLDGILEPRPGRVLDDPVGGGYGRRCGVLHKNFRHVTSSTGEPRVKTPYLCPVLRYK